MPESQIYIPEYMRPEKSTRPHSTVRRHAPKLGNPTPLGLMAFALSVFVSALYNLHAFDAEKPNVIISVAIFTGGVVQFASGMWEFKVGNTFGGTGFSAFGGFWASYALISQSFVDKAIDEQYYKTMGIFSLSWLIFTFIFTLACIRTNLGVLTAFILLTITFACEVVFFFTEGTAIFIKIAGVFGLLTSLTVWYCLAAVLLTPDLSPISLPLWDLSVKSD